MYRPLVVIADSVFPNLKKAEAVFSDFSADLRVASDASAEAIMEIARDADAVMVTYAPLTEQMISRMDRCRVIARFGIGVDNVDIKAATRAGIVVCNVPDYCLDEVSDHAIALLLALARKIPFSNSLVSAGKWSMPAVEPIYRLRGKRLGLVGFGKIPQMVAPKAAALGLEIVAYDPFVGSDMMERSGVTRAEFEELVKTSDFISVHCPLVSATNRLFNAQTFRMMKPTAYLVNTARGQIVDDVALAAALDAGELAGAALDVLPQEPPVGSPLIGRGDVILTPHTSFYSVESLDDLQTKAAEEVVRVLSGKEPRNAVNREIVGCIDSRR